MFLVIYSDTFNSFPLFRYNAKINGTDAVPAAEVSAGLICYLGLFLKTIKFLKIPDIKIVPTITTGEKINAMYGHHAASLPLIIEALTFKEKIILTRIAIAIVSKLYIFTFFKSGLCGDNLKKTHRDTINKGINTIRDKIIFSTSLFFQITGCSSAARRRRVGCNRLLGFIS